MMLIRVIALALCLTPLSVYAHSAGYNINEIRCDRTPSIATSNYPGYQNIPSNNKLAIPAGKAIFSEGQLVYFYGRVLDENCVPVHNAKIELWQANPSGKYRFATKAALTTPDATFAGAGRTYTNNLGEFMFITVYPGPYSWTGVRENGTRYTIRRAPHFNVRVTHDEFRPFNTNLFFEEDARNSTDAKYRHLSGVNQSRVSMQVDPRGNDWNAGVQATTDIVIPGRDPWKNF